MFVNRYYLEFFAQTLDAIKDMGWATFLHPDDAAACVEAYRTAFERQERYGFQCRFLRRDGKYRWLQNVGEPRYARDRTFLGFAGCSMDVTDIEAVEAPKRNIASYLSRSTKATLLPMSCLTIKIVRSTFCISK